ncbi:hypothetical protein [Pseudoflavonifractor sp. 524-17]|uniref:hypothetical protein n=1 Tax=Pseudoflavonifractor sp. 524-17 TaxID=2304577 RepID=UPI0013794139|nr:hypothetical protein [Pseudoflavonifractor sp. 524-17]
MMKMSFDAVAKKLFGVNYERLTRTLFLELVVFWGLHTAGFQVQIAPSILYLMTGTFSAGIMWQALSAGDGGANMENMFMLPFENRSLVFSYTAALGAYTLLTKTAGLLAVVLAVSAWSGMEVAGSVLCGVSAVLVTVCVYPRKRLRGVLGALWAAVLLAAIFLLSRPALLFPVLAVSCLAAILLLSRTDAYAFRCTPGKSRGAVKTHRRYSVWRYLFRYLTAHKNYLVNTAAMWGVACVLPVLLGQIEARFVLPIGFGILSMNTPICILLSCDPALEQTVRFLPKQGRGFCAPYCLFIFVCNLAADAVFLCSWQIQIGTITPLHVLTAAFFALLSAAGSVLLEWHCPIRGWKIESDLWHHPRKYVVPAGMLLLAGLASLF